MDIVDLKEFYASRLGNSTKRLISGRLRPKMEGLSGGKIVGLGYALPYFEDCAADAQVRLAFMMARQGVIRWPEEGPAASVLVDEYDLPLLESAIDVALVIHGLELSESPVEMLKEVWRVLAPQGRLILVVPNRRGLWARFDTSPFGHGQPFSSPQLSGLLRESRFSVMSWSHALFFPPSNRTTVLSVASTMEKVGGRLMPGVSGVIIVEAVKQVYAIASGKRARRQSLRLKPVLAPLPAPRLSESEGRR